MYNAFIIDPVQKMKILKRSKKIVKSSRDIGKAGLIHFLVPLVVLWNIACVMTQGVENGGDKPEVIHELNQDVTMSEIHLSNLYFLKLKEFHNT